MKVIKHKMVNNKRVVGVKLELEDMGLYVDTYQSVLNPVEQKLKNLPMTLGEDVKVSWNNSLGCYHADDVDIENNSIEVTDVNVLYKFIQGELLGNIIISGFESVEEDKGIMADKIVYVVKKSSHYSRLVFVMRVNEYDDCSLSVNVHFKSKDDMIKFVQRFYRKNKYITVREYGLENKTVPYENIDSVLGDIDSEKLSCIQNFGFELSDDETNFGYLYL